MGCPAARHQWLVAPLNEAVRTHRSAPEPFGIDAHRNRRGPFTATGSLIRAVADDALLVAPDLIAIHIVTLLSVAPELRKLVDVAEDVRQAVSVSREGDPPAWNRRISNGVVDFVLGYFGARRSSGHITIANVDEADPADLDVISVLLRRADPETVRLSICTRSDRLPPPLDALLDKSVVRQAGSAKFVSAERGLARIVT